jgi:hypothetical protein
VAKKALALEPQKVHEDKRASPGDGWKEEAGVWKKVQS